MNEDIPLPFDLPAVARKKVSAAFDGGRITSESGGGLSAQARRRLGVDGHPFARVIPDKCDADRVIHLLPDILRAHMFAMLAAMRTPTISTGCGVDPALQAGLVAAYPIAGRDLCSQPSRTPTPTITPSTNTQI